MTETPSAASSDPRAVGLTPKKPADSFDSGGGVLGASMIHSRHADIFADNYSEAFLQPASYDLRIATTKMILPDGTRIPEGQRNDRSFTLRPGNVAFVSTLERLHLPPGLCGIVSIKFSYAIRGILILMGMNVDPGYGCDVAEGRRLHFILANVGTEDLPVNPGLDRIASLQLLPVVNDLHVVIPARPTHLPMAPNLTEDLFSQPQLRLGLSLFENEVKLDREMRILRERVEEHVRGLNQVVLFGHFLLGTAIIGVLLTLLLGWVGDQSMARRVRALSDNLPHTAAGFFSFLLLVVMVFGLIPAYGGPLIRRLSRWILRHSDES